MFCASSFFTVQHRLISERIDHGNMYIVQHVHVQHRLISDRIDHGKAQKFVPYLKLGMDSMGPWQHALDPCHTKWRSETNPKIDKNPGWIEEQMPGRQQKGQILHPVTDP